MRSKFARVTRAIFAVEHASPSLRMLIRVYCGPGVGERSLAAVLEALRDESSAAVVTLNANELLQSAGWEQDCCCLVFPGGRDVPYLEALAGAGCARIRRYVEGGGSYLGLCAGAYFGSAYCEFEKCEADARWRAGAIAQSPRSSWRSPSPPQGHAA